jgi:hypothetical protein
MLTEVQHAQSEDEAQEFEEIMHDGTVPQIAASLSLLCGAFLICLFMFGILFLCGFFGDGDDFTHQSQDASPAGFADVERAEPSAL